MLHLDLAEKETFKHFILQRRQNQENRRMMWFAFGPGPPCGMLLDPSCCLRPLWGATGQARVSWIRALGWEEACGPDPQRMWAALG